MANGTVLVVDDDESTCDLLEMLLVGEGYDVKVETSAAAAFAHMDDLELDAILTDLHMDGLSGADLCRRVETHRPELPVVVITGHVSVDAAVEAMRAGAYDFLTKPIDVKLLSPVVARAVRHHRLGREV